MPAAPRQPRRTHAAGTADPALLSIGALSRATGIPVATLRTWERRYEVPAPVRKPSGHRLYPASAVDHLRKVARLLEAGHRPGEALTVPVQELDALLALSGSVAGPPRSSGGPAGRAPDLAALLAAVRVFDRESLLEQLRSAWAQLGPMPFLESCAGPFLVEIGRTWKDGELAIRHEHFASACLGGFLREVREPFDRAARGRRVVAATLSGDPHEGGVLMASLVMAVRGRRVLYLGTGMPAAQLAEAAAGPDVEAVAVSISASLPRARAGRALASLRAALPARVALWTGGAGAPAPARGIERLAGLPELDARLGRRH